MIKAHQIIQDLAITGVISVQVRRSKLRRRKKPGNIKWLLKILAFLLIMFSLYSFVHSSFFSVSLIKVIGAKSVSDTDILALSGLIKGENIFKIDREKAEEKISTHAMVAGVKVQKRFPRTIEVILEERIPAALIPISGGFMHIDMEGFVLRKDNQLNIEPLPIITGLDLPNTMTVGEKINSEKLDVGLKMIEQMDQEAKEVIAEINVFDSQKLKAFTVQGTEVRLGNGENFQEKFGKFLLVLKEEEKRDRLGDIEYIDLSLSGRPVVCYRK